MLALVDDHVGSICLMLLSCFDLIAHFFIPLDNSWEAFKPDLTLDIRLGKEIVCALEGLDHELWAELRRWMILIFVDVEVLQLHCQNMSKINLLEIHGVSPAHLHLHHLFFEIESEMGFVVLAPHDTELGPWLF